MTGADATGPSVFALLDDDDASAERPTSRLYTGYLHEHRCTDPATLDATCAALAADLAAGRHAVLLGDYEWGARLIGAGTQRLAADDTSSLRLLVFSTLQRLDADGVAAWLAGLEGNAEPAPAGVTELQPDVSRPAFEAAIGRIHQAIRDGETYQVNYTYRLHGSAWGDPVALYRRLRRRQRVGYGALLRLPTAQGDATKTTTTEPTTEPTTEWVLSRSPELFVRHQGGTLLARPMKGTAPRARAPESDSETARLLHHDTKNRAENLMIVDLLRNDIGRIARIGSVKVPQLFQVEPYATVFQMTSTIEATRRDDVDLAGLLRALFPCGSITGAPKHRTMHWIAELEPSPRGLYTGAIGWLEPGTATCPDLCLSVAIRTLTLGAADGAGRRPLRLGVGGGIVKDSVAADEYTETRWKARFLSALDPGVELFETMRVDVAAAVDVSVASTASASAAATAEPAAARSTAAVALRGHHLARLARSAAAMGFDFDADAFDLMIDRECAAIVAEAAAAVQAVAAPKLMPAPAAAWRLRIALSHDGRLSARRAPMADLPDDPVGLIVAPEPLPLQRPLAAHKTTQRAEYDAGIQAAEAAGAFDSLFFDALGRLVEGGRTTVLLQLGGRWFTPPVADGALPGVMRAVVLADPQWAAAERTLTRDDLQRAETIMVCNALRGVRQACLLPP